MLNRNHPTSDPFPARCEVRGCAAAPQDWFHAEEATFDVCGEHELELRAGEPYLLVDGEVLVGQDSTGQIVSVHRERTATSETAVIRLGREGVVHQEVSLDASADLTSALDALDADALEGRGGRDREDR
jgi:hypothetical protein